MEDCVVVDPMQGGRGGKPLTIDDSPPSITRLVSSLDASRRSCSCRRSCPSGLFWASMISRCFSRGERRVPGSPGRHYNEKSRTSAGSARPGFRGANSSAHFRRRKGCTSSPSYRAGCTTARHLLSRSQGRPCSQSATSDMAQQCSDIP